MLQMVKHIVFILTAIAICSCNRVDFKGLFIPTGDGVEKRFEQSAEMNKDLKADTVHTEGSYIFYVAADPHINTTHRNLTVFNGAFRNDAGAAFGVILGDCIDVRDNLPKYMEALAYDPDRHTCNHELFHILGNHDVFFNGWDDFKEIVGPSAYWFEVEAGTARDLYISLDTATGTLGRKQSEWLRTFLAENRQSYRHCIIMTHTNFFYTDNSQTGSGNLPIEECFWLIDLLGRHDVSLVLQGHDHYREDLSYNGVRYVVLGTIRDESEAPEYLKVEVGPDDIHLDWQTRILPS